MPADRPRLDRNQTLRWVIAVSTSVHFSKRSVIDDESSAEPFPASRTDAARVQSFLAGERWELTMTTAQWRLTQTLCDVIIPADAGSVSAAELGVQDYLDEWISVPHALHVQDRLVIVPGLKGIDEESIRRFGAPFGRLSSKNQEALCNEICSESTDSVELMPLTRFFARFRDLAAAGFFSTRVGINDLMQCSVRDFATPAAALQQTLRQLGLC